MPAAKDYESLKLERERELRGETIIREAGPLQGQDLVDLIRQKIQAPEHPEGEEQQAA